MIYVYEGSNGGYPLEEENCYCDMCGCVFDGDRHELPCETEDYQPYKVCKMCYEKYTENEQI